MFKKFLAMLMALVMLVPMYSSGVFAETAKTFIDGYEIMETIDSWDGVNNPTGSMGGYSQLVKSDGCLYVPYDVDGKTGYHVRSGNNANTGITSGSRGYSVDFNFGRLPDVTSYFFKLHYYKDGSAISTNVSDLLGLRYKNNVQIKKTAIADTASFMEENKWYTFRLILTIDGTTLKMSVYIINRDTGEVLPLMADEVLDNSATESYSFGYMEWIIATGKTRYYNDNNKTHGDTASTTTTSEGNYPVKLDNFATYTLKDVRKVPVLYSVETSYEADDNTYEQYWYVYDLNPTNGSTGGFSTSQNIGQDNAAEGTNAAYVSLSGADYTYNGNNVSLKNILQFYHVKRGNLSIPSHDILTWSADVKNTGLTDSGDYIPLGIKNTGNAFVCAMIATEDGYKLGHWLTPANNHTTSDVNTTVTTTLGKDDKWHRYTICYDSTNFIAWYYIDGVYIGQTKGETGGVISGNATGTSYFPVTFPEGTSAEKPVIYAVDNVEAYAYGKAINPTITVTADGTAVETNLPEGARLLNVYADLKTKTNAAKPAKAYLALKDKTDNSLIKLAVAEIVYDADGKAKVMNLSLDTSGVSSLNNKKLELFIWDGLTPVEKLNPLY